MTTFFSQIYLSATDFSFYRKIARQNLSQTLQYFFLLLLIMASLTTVVYFYTFKAGIESFALWAQKNLPAMEIRNGILSSTAPQPYSVQEKDFAFILDTTGKITRFDPLIPNGVLVTRDRVSVKRQGLETQDIVFNWVKELQITAEKIQVWKDKIIPLLIPILFVSLLIGLVLSKTLQAFIFSLVILIFSNPQTTGLGMRELFNLSLYAATPALLLGLVIQLLRLEIPYFQVIYFALYAAFMTGAFWQSKIKQDKENNPFFE